MSHNGGMRFEDYDGRRVAPWLSNLGYALQVAAFLGFVAWVIFRGLG